MTSKERVFHIDQECFIIYAEDLSSRKERFLRVGNSMALHRFGEGLTFLSLITPLFPGDAFKEPEIFSPNVDKRIIGLKSVTDRFVTFLQNEGVDTSHVKVSVADGQGHPQNGKFTEGQFLHEMKKRQTRVRHSFASFYDDGNVRIFNHNACMFDLNESLRDTLDEPKETDLLTFKNVGYYRECYAKSGIIYSGQSLFVFSHGEFACLSDNTEWVTDAVRVGIDPGKVSFLYIVPSVEPDSLWLKTFIRRMGQDSGSKMRIVVKGQPPDWLGLVSDEIFVPLYPDRESVEVRIGEVRLFFQNQRINIYHRGVRLQLNAKHGFLKSGNEIGGEYVTAGGKKPLSLVLGAKSSDSDSNGLQIIPYNPVIFVGQISGSDDAEVSDPSEPNILMEQRLGMDKSSVMTVQNVLLRTKVNAVPENLDPFLFFSKEYDLQQVQAKYEAFRTSLGKDFVLNQADSDRCKARYEKIMKDKQFYLDEQQRLLDFIDKLDDKEYQSEYHSTRSNDQSGTSEIPSNRSESKNGTLSEDENDGKNIGDSHIRESSMKSASVPSPSADEKSNFDDEASSADNLAEKSSPDDFSDDTSSDDSYNAQELLQTGSFDEYADKVKPMNVGRKYQYNGEDGLDGMPNDTDDDETTKKSGARWWMWLIPLLLFLILLGILAYILWPHIQSKGWKTHKSMTQKEFIDQMNEKYGYDEASTLLSPEEAFLNGMTPPSDEEDKQYSNYNPNEGTPIRSVKTSFYYKFHMTTEDKIELTNIIAQSNDYQKMGKKHSRKYESDDPHWIYPGNILTMPDGSNVTVVGGDTMWSLCETYLLNEINSYELEVRNLIEATKTKAMAVGDAKIRFAQIKAETHSQMVRDFMDALLAQSNYYGWEPEIVFNE
ncbi:MAG: hypothetical protein J6W76_00415 [Spirochaetales bacterium]|nr:hypothetical protein [Spirochaetales bacterium]